MMMPANFSAVAENEMTYVVGGSIADYLAPAMEAAQWSNFNKNMITIVGNTYLNKFINSTVGAVFSGEWTFGKGVDSFGAVNGAIWDKFVGSKTDAGFSDKAYGVANIALNVLGNMAAIYNLGFGTAKNAVEKDPISVKNTYLA